MKDWKNIGYILGRITGIVLWTCFMAIVIAFTAKFIFWII